MPLDALNMIIKGQSYIKTIFQKFADFANSSTKYVSPYNQCHCYVRDFIFSSIGGEYPFLEVSEIFSISACCLSLDSDQELTSIEQGVFLEQT